MQIGICLLGTLTSISLKQSEINCPPPLVESVFDRHYQMVDPLMMMLQPGEPAYDSPGGHISSMVKFQSQRDRTQGVMVNTAGQ